MTIDIPSQITDAYRRMAKEARYRPAAPSDGIGNITGRLDLAAEVAAYTKSWWAEEEAQDYPIGCPSYRDRPALIWTVEAARLICGGYPTNSRRAAARLLRMAADDLEARP